MTVRFLVAIVALLLCAAPLYAETAATRSYLFDGTSFQESAGEGAILVRDGVLPALADAGTPREDPLPSGTGAVAVLCYRQSSGGKLRRQPAVQPLPAVAVSVHGSSFTLAARTDAKGYLILALPPGTYEFKLLNLSKRVVVEPGRTTLTSIRGGKRMVD